METSENVEKDHKIELDSEKPLCRCCLSIEKRMLDATKVNRYFMDLAGINVMSSDGLPLWICYECNALLQKATLFKYKMLRAQTMLYEYVTRCAPFRIDAQDPELAQYASPHLSATFTLTCDSDKGKLGFNTVLQHEKQIEKSELDSIELPVQESSVMDVELPAADEDWDDVKEEHGFSDCDDDLPLLEYRETATQILNEIIKNTEEVKTDPEVNGRKNKACKKKKEPKTKKRKKSENVTETEATTMEKKSIRKPIEIDPDKIRVVTLNPEEQVKQREEESKASLKFPYQCNLCYKGFNFESKLQNHMTKHSPMRGPFSCSLCLMYLPTAYSFTVHSLIHTRRYECLKCGRRMIDKTSIYHHYRTEHEGITTLITCSLCGKVSSNSKTHRGHMRNHHSGERPKCDQCGKTFVNKDSLTEHMQIHEGVKNYECSVCGKRCRTRTQIKHHQLKHSDAKDYYCVECDVRFKTAHSLRQHLQKSLKHKDVETLKYVCSHCPRRYDTAASLVSHVLVQHEGVRAHACGTCGAALATRAALRKHRDTVHRGLRRPPTHVCHTCGKAFRGKSVLQNHQRTHTGEKPFACPVPACGRAFTQRTAMRTHHRRVHYKLKQGEVPDPKAEPPVPCDAWPRSQPLFYVTAGP